MKMKIDEFLPAYDFNEVHTLKVAATAEKTIAAAKEMRPGELSPLVFWMLNLRSLPAKLMGQEGPAADNHADRPFLEMLYEGGFAPLAETQDEIVFGLIGQFWKLNGGQDVAISDPQMFKDFAQSDYAKVAANLAVCGDGEGCVLSTETRIRAPDAQTRKKFAFYWRLISFGSGWIRVMWLRAIRRRAQQAMRYG